MTALSEQAVDKLRGALGGSLLTMEDADYESARRVWNGMIDRRPGLIARCVDPGDVVHAIEFGRDHGLLLAVRGGGHSFPGFSVCDGGMVIDLSPMKGITVDPGQRRARAEAGVVWGELDTATQAFGLATTGGTVSHTGIAGLTLGSGIGWLMRHYGMTPDNLISAQVVTAEGATLTASAEENADLFWGLRGGGGNFGIVTSFEYQLHQVGQVLAGMTIYPHSEALPVIAGWRDAVADAPDELGSAVALLTTPDGTPAVAVAPCWSGPLAAGEAVVAPLRRLGTALVDQVGPMDYLVLQSMIDGAAAPGQRYYERAASVDALTDDLITVLAECCGRCPSPLTMTSLLQLGGAMGRVDPTAMAFPHRRSPNYLQVLCCWIDPADDDVNIAWLNETWSALAPFIGAVDVNHLDRGQDRVREAYGPNYERLLALKRAYDPTNLFRLNQNIRP